ITYGRRRKSSGCSKLTGTQTDPRPARRSRRPRRPVNEAPGIAVTAEVPGRPRLDDDGVLVAVDEDLGGVDVVAIILALDPNAPERAAEERDAPGLERSLPRLVVHEGRHQDIAAVGVLDDNRDEAVELPEVEPLVVGPLRSHR